MKTAMQELIDQLEGIKENPLLDLTSDKKLVIMGIDMAIEAAGIKLVKEKDNACQFAKEYINGNYDGFLSDYYDEKFNNQNK